MAIPIFVTGIGTGVGKTLASAILVEALQADYWKPVQTGVSVRGAAPAANGPGGSFAHGNNPDGSAAGDPEDDSAEVGSLLSNPVSRVHPEVYRLTLPASPHIAAKAEHVDIDVDVITARFHELRTDNPFVVVEGAGGLLVPLNNREFMADLAQRLEARVVLVSRNYLGSINHSLLSARFCRAVHMDVRGWIFNDHFGNYEEEIVHWSGYKTLGRIPPTEHPDAHFVQIQAALWKESLRNALERAGHARSGL